MTLVATLKNAITIDFETEPIAQRPKYPPKPVSVSIKRGAGKPRFYSWGHPTGNNSTLKEATAAVAKAWGSRSPLLFQNAIFDIDVAETHLGVPALPWARVHDSMLMMFLLDPHAPDYHLKESCERLLKWKPEERDAVIDWLIEHQPVAGVKLTRGRHGDNYAGAHICLAPAEVVEPYCNGDVDRTYALAMWCAKKLEKRKMVVAYDRERRMLPVILRMERHGVRADVAALKRDIKRYEAEHAKLDGWLLKLLRVQELNFDAPQQVAQALVYVGLADATKMGITKTGKLAANKEAMKAGVTDKRITAALRWRGAVGTCLKTFLRPWYAQAKSGGRIYVRWNTTRKDSRDPSGARTGRLSSSPNLQNIPKVFKPLFAEHCVDKAKVATLPHVPFKGLLDTPRARQYILADKGHVLIDRDFSSQELRVLAYFENDGIARAFEKTADLDLHQKVADDLDITRERAKTVNFAILYGVGSGHLAEMLDCTTDEAKEIKKRYFTAYPSVKDLIDDLKALAKAGKALRTWGGREYFCEPPKFVNGRMWDFAYKLLNYLVQGSSADLTKEAMIAFHESAESAEADVWLLASVHDELLASVPKALVKTVMERMRRIMSTNWLGTVPMLSTGKVGSTFATMKECE
jgi:DNA polymerase-1